MLADAQPSCYLHQRMNTYRDRSNAQACGAQVASEASTQPQIQQIKLALDVHAASIVVGRMMDGAKPQPPQTFKPVDFLVWAEKQVALAQEVVFAEFCGVLFTAELENETSPCGTATAGASPS